MLPLCVFTWNYDAIIYDHSVLSMHMDTPVVVHKGKKEMKFAACCICFSSGINFRKSAKVKFKEIITQNRAIKRTRKRIELYNFPIEP